MDYKNGKVYKLQCEDGHYYIGSTATELRKRFCNHKTKSKVRNSRVYQHINALGWDKVRIVLVEDFPCESKEHLVRKEDEYIRACRDDPMCLNMIGAVLSAENRTQQASEYRETHKEERKASATIYRQTHKEKHAAHSRAYYHAHKDEINARRRKTDSSASS
jgi:predicted GIY-YIG superfamily endonuclease